MWYAQKLLKYNTINNMEEIRQWIIDWFASHSSLSVAELDAVSKEDYLKKAIIDSFAFVMLISEIDDEFDVAFTNDDFLDSRFPTIDGLATMINERIQN